MTYVFKNMPVFITRKNNKNMYVRIKDTGCHISAPKYFSKEFINQYLMQHETRLLERYKQLRNIQYTILGQPIKIDFELKKFGYEFCQQHLKISHPKSFDIAFKLFLKLEFDNYLTSIQQDIHAHIKKFELTPVSIDTKYVYSKYGSYHSLKNKITLNSYLYMLDRELIKYVIMHEYAHTKEFHHQKTFYDLQHQLCSNDKELSKRLKTLTIPTHFTL